MKLVDRVKALILGLGIALTPLTACDEFRPYDELESHLITIDQTYEPKLETDFEKKYGVQLRAYPEHITQENIDTLSEAFDRFEQGQLEGMQVFLALPKDDGFKRYSIAHYDSDAIYLKDLSEHAVTVHETVHFVHDKIAKTWEFTNDWNNVNVRWKEDGSWNSKTLSEVIAMNDTLAKREDFESRREPESDKRAIIAWKDEEYIALGFVRAPHYGSVSPYGIENLTEHIGEFVTSIKLLDGPHWDLSDLLQFPFYDARLDPQPYYDFAKLGLEHKLLTQTQYDNFVSYMDTNLNDAQPIRNINWEDKAYLGALLINDTDELYDLGDGAYLKVNFTAPSQPYPQAGIIMKSHILEYGYNDGTTEIPLFVSLGSLRYDFENYQIKEIIPAGDPVFLRGENLDIKYDHPDVRAAADKFISFKVS